uniref:Uncharacterized protein n=1 Tax=Ditylenchus dipsaci TaxID=166011 RepID=A0A915EJT3_9BILA
MLSLWVSCGNCNPQFKRNLVITNTVLKGPMLSTISYVCRAYETKGSQLLVREQTKLGQPLNGKACKDPSAKITVVN